jgi:hypothetical protein
MTLLSLIQAAANAVGITIDAHVTVAFTIAPSAPTVLGITSVRGSTMAALNNTITFSAPVLTGNTRVATIVLTHADGTVTTLPALDVTIPTTTFPSVDGDSASVSATDANASGPSVPSAPFVQVTTAPVVVPPVPDAPVITGIVSVLA